MSVSNNGSSRKNHESYSSDCGISSSNCHHIFLSLCGHAAASTRTYAANHQHPKARCGIALLSRARIALSVHPVEVIGDHTPQR
jgi:hypothetical protein